jgi:hypothetical protein
MAVAQEEDCTDIAGPVLSSKRTRGLAISYHIVQQVPPGARVELELGKTPGVCCSGYADNTRVSLFQGHPQAPQDADGPVGPGLV